jgi:hypothetical protein
MPLGLFLKMNAQGDMTQNSVRMEEFLEFSDQIGYLILDERTHPPIQVKQSRITKDDKKFRVRNQQFLR